MAETIPNHVFIIPDGNGRWATRRGLSRLTGHTRGVKRFHEIAETACDLGIPYLTIWAMSFDNYVKRDKEEVSHLLALLRQELAGKLERKLVERRTRLRVISQGMAEHLDADLDRRITDLENSTRRFDERNLTVLLGYDGKRELASAARTLMEDGLVHREVDFSLLKDASWTADLPSVDLEIRTGEEQPGFSHRSALALPFLAGDAVAYATATLWPDFTPDEFRNTISRFGAFERRYGASSAS